MLHNNDLWTVDNYELWWPFDELWWAMIWPWSTWCYLEMMALCQDNFFLLGHSTPRSMWLWTVPLFCDEGTYPDFILNGPYGSQPILRLWIVFEFYWNWTEESPCYTPYLYFSDVMDDLLIANKHLDDPLPRKMMQWQFYAFMNVSGWPHPYNTLVFGVFYSLKKF